MNTKRLLKLARAIETGRVPKGKAPLGFSMRVFISNAWTDVPDMSGRECGTVACIGGWTRTLFGGSDTEETLGLTSKQGSALLMPENWMESNTTPAEAAAVLRHLAATGEVDWSIAQVPA